MNGATVEYVGGPPIIINHHCSLLCPTIDGAAQPSPSTLQQLVRKLFERKKFTRNYRLLLRLWAEVVDDYEEVDRSNLEFENSQGKSQGCSIEKHCSEANFYEVGKLALNPRFFL